MKGWVRMAHTKSRNTGKPRKSATSGRKPGFLPGNSGVCEAQLWEFKGPSGVLENDEAPVERVAAGSLEEALKFMRRRYPDFIIAKAKAAGVIALLSGSPLD